MTDDIIARRTASAFSDASRDDVRDLALAVDRLEHKVRLLERALIAIAERLPGVSVSAPGDPAHRVNGAGGR